jgi:hypothetical protein
MNLFDSLSLDTVPGLSPQSEPKRPLLVHDRDHDFILRIDNSTLETFQTCSRSAFYYCVERRQRHPSPALAFGGAVHEALEHIYRYGYTAADAAMQRGLDYLHAAAPPSPDEWRTPAYLIETLQAYVKHYSLNDAIVPYNPDNNPYVEIPFSLSLGEVIIDAELPYTYAQITDQDSTEPCFINKLTIMWSGKIDIAAHYGDHRVYVVDHKTTSIAGPTFFSDFMLSQQMVGYNWALRKILDSPIAGTIVNALIIRKPTRTGKGIEFERQTYFHQDWHVTEWQSDVLSEVSRFIYSLTNDSWPKLTKWCFGKYGKCPYHEVCTLPPIQRHIMLSSPEYVNVTWSPLDKPSPVKQ